MSGQEVVTDYDEQVSEIERTSNHELAMQWADAVMGFPNIARPWIPQDRFVEAIRSSGSLSLTRLDKGLFGIGYGPDPEINSSWTHFSLPANLPKERTSDFTLAGRWSAYSAEPIVAAEREPVEELTDQGAIKENIGAFLKEHAPDSSTLPGNPEVIFWGVIREENDALAALAAIVQWESGAKMLSSVATRTDLRGRGLSQQLVKGILRLCHEKGIDRVSLAVFTKNLPARTVYERTGFVHMGDFNYFERQQTPAEHLN